MKTPITIRTIRQHLTYSCWKYILLVILAVAGWSMVYTVTAYQPPEEKKIDLFVFTGGYQERLTAYMEDVRQREMSDMEEMESVFILVDDAYTPMQLMTYIAAGEGDLYMLPKNYFQDYSSSGAFVPLEDIPGLTDKLDAAGISYDRGWRTNAEINEKHLYGIPVANLPGLRHYAYAYDDHYLSLIITNKNDENCIKFLQIFLDDMLDPDHQPVMEAYK